MKLVTPDFLSEYCQNVPEIAFGTDGQILQDKPVTSLFLGIVQGKSIDR